ncbi:hypothetical protein JCM10296v2_007656 [Rhodotorula toruloides]
MCSRTLRHLNIVAETSPADEAFLASLGGPSRLRELRIIIEESSGGIVSFSSTLSRLTKHKRLVVQDTFACPALILHGPPSLKHIVYEICGDSMLALEHVHSDDDRDHDSEDEGEPETDDEEKAKIAALSAVSSRPLIAIARSSIETALLLPLILLLLVGSVEKTRQLARQIRETVWQRRSPARRSDVAWKLRA